MQKKQYQRHGLKKKVGFRNRVNTKIIYITDSDTPDHLDVSPKQVYIQDSQNGILGYKDHFIITLDGKIHEGRNEESVGFKVEETAVTILLIGRDNFTDHQIDSLKKLVKNLKTKYKEIEIINNQTSIQKV